MAVCCGSGRGCWPSPSLCQDKTSWRSALEQRCPHRARGLQVPLSLRNMEQSTVVSRVTTHVPFAGFQQENRWVYFVSAPLVNSSPHSGRRWPLLGYTKGIYHLQSQQSFFCPSRTDDVAGTWHPSALCLFRREGCCQCPAPAHTGSTRMLSSWSRQLFKHRTTAWMCRILAHGDFFWLVHSWNSALASVRTQCEGDRLLCRCWQGCRDSGTLVVAWTTPPLCQWGSDWRHFWGIVLLAADLTLPFPGFPWDLI